MPIAFYDSNLTDAQWSFLEPMVPARKKRGRPPTDRRSIVDAILYVIKAGIQWRMLPSDFPPYQTVFHIFRQWTLNHTWEALNARLRAHVREAEGKRCRPTAAILDSQSVKSDPHGGKVGYDAAKRIKGRKRHILVDTLGLLLSVWVTPANVTERVGAQDLLARTLNCFTWLRLLGWTAAIMARCSPNGSEACAQSSRCRWSSVRTRDSKFCPAVGLSNEPLPGLCASAVWSGTMKLPKPAPKPGSISR